MSGHMGHFLIVVILTPYRRLLQNTAVASNTIFHSRRRLLFIPTITSPSRRARSSNDNVFRWSARGHIARHSRHLAVWTAHRSFKKLQVSTVSQRGWRVNVSLEPMLSLRIHRHVRTPAAEEVAQSVGKVNDVMHDYIRPVPGVCIISLTKQFQNKV